MKFAIFGLSASVDSRPLPGESEVLSVVLGVQDQKDQISKTSTRHTRNWQLKVLIEDVTRMFYMRILYPRSIDRSIGEAEVHREHKNNKLCQKWLLAGFVKPLKNV